jgi:hypothetical protein
MFLQMGVWDEIDGIERHCQEVELPAYPVKLARGSDRALMERSVDAVEPPSEPSVPPPEPPHHHQYLFPDDSDNLPQLTNVTVGHPQQDDSYDSWMSQVSMGLQSPRVRLLADESRDDIPKGLDLDLDLDMDSLLDYDIAANDFEPSGLPTMYDSNEDEDTRASSKRCKVDPDIHSVVFVETDSFGGHLGAHGIHFNHTADDFLSKPDGRPQTPPNSNAVVGIPVESAGCHATLVPLTDNLLSITTAKALCTRGSTGTVDGDATAAVRVGSKRALCGGEAGKSKASGGGGGGGGKAFSPRGAISLEALAACYDMPREDAARKLGIGCTCLKKICRRYGIKRWPCRKLGALSNHVEELRKLQNIASQYCPERRALQRAIADAQETKQRIYQQADYPIGRDLYRELHTFKKSLGTKFDYK